MSAKKIIEAKCNIKVKMLIQETSRTFMVSKKISINFSQINDFTVQSYFKQNSLKSTLVIEQLNKFHGKHVLSSN
jgi:hypothetical protein